jgi:hypothetical protein
LNSIKQIPLSQQNQNKTEAKSKQLNTIKTKLKQNHLSKEQIESGEK